MTDPVRSDTSSPSGTWLLLLALVAALVLLFERTLTYQQSVMAARAAVVDVVPRMSSDSPPSGNARAGGDGSIADVSATSADATAADSPVSTSLAGTAPASPPAPVAAPGTPSVPVPTSVPSAVPAPQREAAAEGLEAMRRLLTEAAVLDVTSDLTDEGGDWRERDLAVLADLSDAIHFPRDSAVPDARTREVLDDVSAVLALHPKAPVTVEVSGREQADARRDRVLRRERGRAIIAALVARGLAFSRFSIDAADGEANPSGMHRIHIVTGEVER